MCTYDLAHQCDWHLSSTAKNSGNAFTPLINELPQDTWSIWLRCACASLWLTAELYWQTFWQRRYRLHCRHSQLTLKWGAIWWSTFGFGGIGGARNCKYLCKYKQLEGKYHYNVGTLSQCAPMQMQWIKPQSELKQLSTSATCHDAWGVANGDSRKRPGQRQWQRQRNRQTEVKWTLAVYLAKHFEKSTDWRANCERVKPSLASLVMVNG